MDMTLIVYTATGTEALAQLLAEVLAQREGLNLELIAVDGIDVQVDYDKLATLCSDHDIRFSVIRQQPMNRIAPGFHEAASMAKGAVLVFLNPLVSIPPDFLEVAYRVGQNKRVLLLRPWVNVALPTGECQGFWAPPDNCSIIMPRGYYAADELGTAVWSSSTWSKADAYILATRLAACHPGRVGMSILRDYEYREWVTRAQATPYTEDLELERLETDYRDIRRFVWGEVEFEHACSCVSQFQSSEYLETLIRQVIGRMQSSRAVDSTLAEFVPIFQRELDNSLDNLFQSGQLMLRPNFVVEPDEAASTLRVRSTGDVLLPYERMVG